ncbi:hypothetical protein Hanom_Chr07g00597831 [Helianthus anomalus]
MKTNNGSIFNTEVRKRLQVANMHRSKRRTQDTKQQPQIRPLIRPRTRPGTRTRPRTRSTTQLTLHPVPPSLHRRGISGNIHRTFIRIRTLSERRQSFQRSQTPGS